MTSGRLRRKLTRRMHDAIVNRTLDDEVIAQRMGVSRRAVQHIRVNLKKGIEYEIED